MLNNEGVRLSHCRCRLRGMAKPFLTEPDSLISGEPGPRLVYRMSPKCFVCSSWGLRRWRIQGNEPLKGYREWVALQMQGALPSSCTPCYPQVGFSMALANPLIKDLLSWQRSFWTSMVREWRLHKDSNCSIQAILSATYSWKSCTAPGLAVLTPWLIR